MRIGITGASGFVGLHLQFSLHQQKDKYEPVLIDKSDFLDESKLVQKLKKCDVVVHLAGLNHGEEKEIYETNVGLTKKLLACLNKTGNKPKTIFLSSTHNVKNTAYGRSKKDSEKLIALWGRRNQTMTTSLVAPHIFGEFGKPHYNSAIATLCFELAEQKPSRINHEAKLELIYVGDVCSQILEMIYKKISKRKLRLRGKKIMLKDAYSILKGFRDEYFKNVIPNLKDKFELNLFNTFRSYLYPNYFPVFLNIKADQRGMFVELTKTNTLGQTSFSSSNKKVIRGNHYHTRKIESFCVISGEALIKIRRLLSNEIFKFKVSGKKPSYVDIPTYYVHSIENIGTDELLTVFWVNEIYDSNDTDTFPEKV